MVLDEPVAGTPAMPSPARPRVLVVEDEEAVLETIRGILELDGYDVSTAMHGEQAIELLESSYYDLMLTDLRLGDGMDGIQLIGKLQERWPDTVSILLTGYASMDSAIKALREGAYDYLVKPCDVLELRTTIARGL